jgi:enoyl-CoA hydratase/3-hydroxyacyl-CoA dehydrogenase
MRDTDVSKVAVIGTGNMGHGIAEVTAIAGYDVVMQDIEKELIQEGYERIKWSLEKLAKNEKLSESPKSVLGRIETYVDLPEAVSSADVVIEAIPERMDLKRDLFADLEEYTPDHTILASNTSSLSISEMAQATDRPEQVVGTHFFNPVVKMNLVEVVYGEETTQETAEIAATFVESLDKTPIFVRKDVRGFVVNNVLLPFLIEPAWMVSNDDATIKQADAAMVYQRGYPMGPFELNDMTGLDIGYDVYQEAGKPIPPLLAEKVKTGDHGRKTGKGYYDYEDGPGVEYERSDGKRFDTLRVEARMVNAAARLVGEDIATPEDIDIGMRLGANFPKGTCRRGDKIGLDAILENLESLHDEYGANRYEPHPYLRELVDKGWTGEDTGKGFFEYDDKGRANYTDRQE